MQQTPQQRNDYDCGVISLMIATFLLAGRTELPTDLVGYAASWRSLWCSVLSEKPVAAFVSEAMPLELQLSPELRLAEKFKAVKKSLSGLESCARKPSDMLELFEVIAEATDRETLTMAEKMTQLKDEVDEWKSHASSLQALSSRYRRLNNEKYLALLQDNVGQAQADLAAKRKENQRLDNQRSCLTKLTGALEHALTEPSMRIWSEIMKTQRFC